MSAALAHPQPVGIHAFPLGLSLCTDEHAREALLAGRVVDMPESGDEAVRAYNHFVSNPDGDPDPIRAALPGSVAVLVDVVRFTAGLIDDPPQVDDASAPEVQAVVLAAQAGAALEAGDAQRAERLLNAGADLARDCSPVLAAVLRANAAGTAYDNHANHDNGADASIDETLLHCAAQTLSDTDLHAPLAEIHVLLGQLAHERAAATGASLRQAMHHYYSALQLVTETDEPLLWARAQVALATAQLATPMSAAGDQLRFGVAAQALRAALRVLTHEQHPLEWAAATLNLANALVYAPSMHQGDNLVEAVELYEQVLAQRAGDVDPVGRARVLANQGNALAHLGIFDHARGNLVEARYLFEAAGQHDAVMAVRSVLDEIVRAQAAARGDVSDPQQDAATQQRFAQMSRMPVQAGPTTSGMGVRIDATAGTPVVHVPPRPTVRVLPREGEA